MITAVDTNVLLDVVIPGAPAAASSEAMLIQALSQGSLVICESVYAELVAFFATADRFEAFRDGVGIRLLASTRQTLDRAGTAWREYTSSRSLALQCSECGRRSTVRCDRCGSIIRVRQRMLPDFFIGAHAMIQADRLFTRDRGFFRTYFPNLPLAE